MTLERSEAGDRRCRSRNCRTEHQSCMGKTRMAESSFSRASSGRSAALQRVLRDLEVVAPTIPVFRTAHGRLPPP